MLQLLSRISLVEVLIVGGLIYLLLLRPRHAPSAARPTATVTTRIINGCAVLALGGIVAGALLNTFTLSFAGIMFGAVGLGLSIRGMGVALRQRIGRFFRR